MLAFSFGIIEPTVWYGFHFFSNGLLDPWSSGGVLKSQSDSVVAIVIPNGAHHLDLRGSNKADPADVISARNLEKKYIASWIKSP